MMKYGKIVDILAPCGLNCVECLGHEDGKIRKCAAELQALLDGFESYYERFSKFVPTFGKYPPFNEMLELLAGVDCAGCRGNESKRELCGIARCHKDKDFDFCFQCGEYPCDPEGIDDDLRIRWIRINDRMKEIGVEAYYDEIKDKPRYRQGD